MVQRNKTIVLSNLAARYYKRNGWDIETLNKYLTKGNWVDSNLLHVDDEDEYYILDIGGCIDAERLLHDYSDVEVIPFGPEEINKSRFDLLNSRNW
jgi:hypothetical protein